jgi:PEP-CTERM motif
MNTPLQCNFTGLVFGNRLAGALLLGFLLAAGSAPSARAQGQIASGTVSGSGTGPYTYDLTFSDSSSALSPVGSVWYGWVPGLFYLPGTPTSASAPSGWTANVSGHSVQFMASSAANDIMPGQTLSGFSYQATFTPAELAAAANSGTSVAYSGGLFSDAGYTFTVQAVPEPSAITLLLTGSAGVFLARRRRTA